MQQWGAQAEQWGSQSANQGLRSEAMDKSVLEKANFDLKLRVFHLEQRLSRTENGNDDKTMEGIIEENARELEDRNLLLVKARNAIESLQSELRATKNDLADERHQHSEVAHAKQSMQEQYEVIYEEWKEKHATRLQELKSLQSQLDKHQSIDVKQLQSELERKNEWLHQRDAEIERLSNALETNLASAVVGRNSEEALKAKHEELQQLQAVVERLKERLVTQEQAKEIAEKLQRKTEECRLLEKQREDAEAGRQRALEQVSTSTHQLIELQRTISGLNAETQTREKESKRVSDMEATMKRQMGDLTKQVARLELTKREQAEQLRQQKVRHMSLSQECQKLQEYAREIECSARDERKEKHEHAAQLESTMKHQHEAEIEVLQKRCENWEMSVRTFLAPILGSKSSNSASPHLPLSALQLQDKLQQLNLVQKFFKDTVEQVQNKWQQHFDGLSQEVDKKKAHLETLEGRLQSAKQKHQSSDASTRQQQEVMLKEKRRLEMDLHTAQADCDELKRDAVRFGTLKADYTTEKEARVEAEQRAQRLGENNRVLILELEERRDMIETVKKQVLVLEQERTKLRREKDRAIGTLQTLLKMENSGGDGDEANTTEAS